MVSSTPWPHFTLGKDPVPILQGTGWAPEPVWTGGKSRPHRDSIPDRPAPSQSLYQLSYPAHLFKAYRVQSNRSVKLTTDLSLVSKLRMNGATPPPPHRGLCLGLYFFYEFDVWLTVHRSSMWNKKPTRCHLVYVYFYLSIVQHVSGHHVPIFRS